tara:strand:+ start:297 stop:404 length:108 start_codon:yes stop_codon:yes gene_type:complete
MMKKILFILLLFCSACAVTEKCETEPTKKECCSKK